MESGPPVIALRRRLLEQLAQAQRALADERQGTEDALAVARNVAAAVLADIDMMGSSPRFG